jgi:hypothetical protein
MTCDAPHLAAIEEARRLHAVFLDQLGKLGLPLASFEPVRDRLHDNIEDLTFDASRIYDRAILAERPSPPWREDKAVVNFDSAVESARKALMKAVEVVK